MSERMKQQYKGGVVMKVEHKITKRRGVVRLDKDRMTFFAREDDTDYTVEPFADKDGHVVRHWLEDRLSKTTEGERLEWLAVIDINCNNSHRYYASKERNKLEVEMNMEAERYWIALSKDKREWRKLAWEQCAPRNTACLPENDRYAASQHYEEGPLSQQLTQYKRAFRVPHYDDGRTIIFYTDELWHGLEGIVKHIEQSRKTLEALLTTKEGTASLQQIGAGKKPLMLGAGGKR